MRLYDNAFPTHYGEIQTWYPLWYRDVAEMDALWKAWGFHLDNIRDSIIKSVDNNFIDTMDADSLARLETFLKISHDEPRTLEARRRFIKALIVGHGKIGRAEIIALLSIIAEGDIRVSFSNSLLEIIFVYATGEVPSAKDCEAIIGSRIPAHLAFNIVYESTPTSIATIYTGVGVSSIDMEITMGVKVYGLD